MDTDTVAVVFDLQAALATHDTVAVFSKPPVALAAADPDADVAELHASIDREVAADMSAAEQPLGEM